MLGRRPPPLQLLFTSRWGGGVLATHSAGQCRDHNSAARHPRGVESRIVKVAALNGRRGARLSQSASGTLHVGHAGKWGSHCQQVNSSRAWATSRPLACQQCQLAALHTGVPYVLSSSPDKGREVSDLEVSYWEFRTQTGVRF